MSDVFGGFAGSGYSSSWTSYIDDVLTEVEEASTKGDLGKVSMLLGDASREWERVVKEDMSALYRNTFRETGAGALPANVRQRSLTIRKRVGRNGVSALNDVSTWAKRNYEINDLVQKRNQIRKIQRSANDTIHSAASSAAERKKARSILVQANQKEEEFNRLIAKANVGPEPEVLYRRRRARGGHTRGTVAARHTAREHFAMLERTAHRDLTNDAYIRGHADQGVEWFIVSDGVDCGWTSHRDPDKANGKVVHVDDIIPYAHPNCQRTFQALPDGPRGKKTEELIQRLTGLDRQTLEQAAKGAVVAGYAFSIGQAVYESPLTRRIVRNIVEDAEIALSENAKKILADWANIYGRNEGLAAAAKGWENNQLSRDRVRAETTDHLARKMESNFDGSLSKRVVLSRQEAVVLGVKNREISLGELGSRYADYLDFIRHDTDTSAGIIRAVGAAGQDEGTIRELYGGSYTFHTMTRFRRKGELLNNYKRAIAAVDKAMEGVDDVTGIDNAVLAQVDLIRASARVIDPLPWARATANIPGGSLRFSVGMTSEGRQDLAQSLWLKMKGQEYRSRFNRVYQQNHLGMVPKPGITIRPRDIYEALQPRVTFFGRNVLNASIYAEGGKIIPVVHVLPGNAYMRQLSLRWRLRSGAVEEFVTGYQDWAGDLRSYLRHALRELPEDMIWTVEAFRNGPITANVRLLSDGVDSYALKLRPRSERIRATYKAFNRDPEHVLDAIKEVVLVPRQWGGYTLTPYETEKIELIVGLATLRKGALAEVAQTIGIAYHRLYALLDVHTRKYGERVAYLIDKIRDARGADVELGVTALRVEDIRRRGRAVLDDALGKVEPRIVKAYNFVEKRYEWIAEGFDPIRHEVIKKADGTIEATSRKIERWRPKVIHRFELLGKKLETHLEGLDRIAERLPLGASLDDFVREVDLANRRDAGFLRLADNTNARDYSDDHFTFKRIYDRVLNDEEIDLDTLEDLVQERFPRLKFLLEKASPEMLVSKAGADTFVDILRITDFLEKRGVLTGEMLDRFPEIKFAHDWEIGKNGEYAYFENQIFLNADMFGRSDGRNQMIQNLMTDWESGWHPRTGDTAHTFVHELGHYVTIELMNTEQKMRLWNKFVDDVPAIRRIADDVLEKDPLHRVNYSPGFIDDVKKGFVSFEEEINGRVVDYHLFYHNIKGLFEAEWFQEVRRDLIGPQVSWYAMQDWAEFLAETFTQMMYGPDDNDFTRVLYEFLREEGIL